MLLDAKWGTENLHTLMVLLCEEVTDRTPLDLRAMEWHESRDTAVRIRVRRRTQPMETVAATVQGWVRTHGLEKTRDAIGQTLCRLN